MYLRKPERRSANSNQCRPYSNIGVPRQKDGYILISAGPDRVYGTTDDLTNFGPVSP